MGLSIVNSKPELLLIYTALKRDLGKRARSYINSKSY
jgi:hypothetical protein